jgi:formate/nitrite transporter FocA (FNT family)
MYFLSVGALLEGTLVSAGLIRNLIPVTLGNIVGGGVMVALVYFIVYRLPAAPRAG